MISESLFLRVKENLGGQQKGPYCIDLVINDFCNLSCFYCSGSIPHNNKKNWSRGVLLRLLDSAMRLSIREFSLTSLTGEPTIFKDIKLLLEEIKKRNFIGTLLTNGTILDEEFAEFLQKINWDILILSLDSFNPDIQYKLRPIRAKKEYLKNITGFLEYTAKYNPKLNLNLNMVVSRLNYGDVYNYFKQAETYGAKNVTLLKLVKMTDKYDKLALSERQLSEFKAMLENIATPINFNHLEWLDIPSADSAGADSPKTGSNGKKKCYFPLYKILIDCDGQVLKCNGDSQRTEFNVREEDLYDIYYKLLDKHKVLRTDPYCWDMCCSPIKALNQEITYYLNEK